MKSLPDQLDDIALGHAFYGKAIAEALKIEWLSPEHRRVLRRYQIGYELTNDSFALQDIAIAIRNMGDA